MFSHKGKIHKIGEIKLVGSNDFPIREIIITQDEEWNPLIPMQLIGKNTGLVEQLGMQEGDTITVKFSIGGQERETSTDELKVYSNNTITFIEQE